MFGEILALEAYVYDFLILERIKAFLVTVLTFLLRCKDRRRWTLFIFIFSLLFFFLLFFCLYFLFLEQLGLGVISHAVTSVTT